MNETEFHRPVSILDLEDGDTVRERINATADECLALAKRFDVAAMKGVHAEILLHRRGRQVVVETQLKAEIEQTCVVSLTPIKVEIDDAFERVYDPDVRPSGEFDETIDLDPGSEDPPEALVDDVVDLGELVAEQLGLSVDPYPRKPGASVDPRYLQTEEPERNNPFAVLKGMKFDG